MATMSPPTAPMRLATSPSAPGRSGSAMRTRYWAMAQRLGDQCKQAVSASRYVFIDVLTPREAGDLTHQRIGEGTAVGVVVPLQGIVRIHRRRHFHGAAEADDHVFERP